MPRAVPGLRFLVPALTAGVLVLLLTPTVWAAISVLTSTQADTLVAGPTQTVSSGFLFAGKGSKNFKQKFHPCWEGVRFAIILALEILYSNGLVWLAGKALQPLITNVTLWGNASKLLAVAGGSLLSYACMRFWTFAGGFQDRPDCS